MANDSITTESAERGWFEDEDPLPAFTPEIESRWLKPAQYLTVNVEGVTMSTANGDATERRLKHTPRGERGGPNSIAHHEAGHAIVALALGWNVDRVMIRPRTGETIARSQHSFYNEKTGTLNVITIMQRIAVAVAGLAAENRSGYGLSTGWGGDKPNACSFIRPLCRDIPTEDVFHALESEPLDDFTEVECMYRHPESLEVKRWNHGGPGSRTMRDIYDDWIEEFKFATYEIVDQHWELITWLADELLQRKSIGRITVQ